MSLRLMSIWFLAILFIFTLPTNRSASILAVFPFTGRSQYIFAEHYLRTLAARGHNLTVINTFGSERNETNFHVIGATRIHDAIAAFSSAYDTKASQWKILSLTTEFLNLLNENILSDNAVQRLLKSEQKFDLVIAETVQTEVLYGLAQHFDAQLMGISSYGTDRHIDELMGNISPLAYNPMLLSARTESMTYVERLWNLWEATVAWLHKRCVHMPTQLALYRKYFPNANKQLPEVLQSFSLMLLGQHFTLSYARPYLPNMIEVAGLHLTQSKSALPTALETFINEAPFGVIYFSMGSNIRSADLPSTTRELLMQVFGSLKQRVLWKFEAEQLPGKPANVFIQKWFPQPVVLAHTNVKLFITHGGLLSTIEAIYYGKPVLGLPIFYDQFLNVARAKKAGYGLGLDFSAINATKLRENIIEILTNDSYAHKAQQLSTLFRDQKETALERAIWWTDYVLRHKGAPHMRAASLNLNYMQLHSLDTIAALYGGALLCAVLLIFSFNKLWKFIFSFCKHAIAVKLKKQ